MIENMGKKIKSIYRGIISLVPIPAFIFLFSIEAAGLNPGKPVSRYIIDKWEIADGLPSQTILSITQTPDGYLWIAASRGLIRFDGIKFTQIPFIYDKQGQPAEADKNVIPDILFVDRTGTLWIGSQAGLTSYRFKDASYTTYTAKDRLTKDRVRFIRDDMKGNLWISFFSGFMDRFSNGEFVSFGPSKGLTGNKINGIIENRKGSLLVATREKGIFLYRYGRFVPYPVQGIENGLTICMFEDHSGSLWIGTNTGLYEAVEKRTVKYTTQDGLSDNYITDILEDSDQNLWVGTVKGLNRIQKKEGGGVVIEQMLEPLTITCVTEDREKSLWIGSYDSGMRRLKEGKFMSYNPHVSQTGETEKGEIFISLCETPQGDTWIGGVDGKLWRCRDGSVTESLCIPGLTGTFNTAVLEDDDGTLWVGTNGKGVFYKKNRGFVSLTTREGLADNLVTSIFKDSSGNLWFGTFDGASRLRNGIMDSLKSPGILRGKIVYNIYEDKNHHILLATDKGIHMIKNGDITRKDSRYYLKDIPISCIYEDPGETKEKSSIFWVATHGEGLKRIKNGKITSYTTAEGMITNFIYQFFEDPQGKFWLMSDSGILRLDKMELNLFADDPSNPINCVSFGIADGLPDLEFNNEFSRHSALKTRNGEFRFITKKGISVVNPTDIPINKVPPPIIMESVFFNDQPIPLYTEPAPYSARGVTRLKFLFTAPSFLSSQKIRFKYKLDGVDTQWMFLPLGKERAAVYQNLRPGLYTFHVTACNSEGLWNPTASTLQVLLKSYFTETAFFKIGVVLFLTLSAAGGTILYKKKALEKKAKYKDAPLNPRFADECVKKLLHLVEVEKIYRDPNLSLPVMSEKMSISHHLLSRILNEKMNRNFPDFINQYRVEEAKVILQDPQRKDQKIALVAFDAGFNTVVAFYTAFKKNTGLTPAQFKKKNETNTRP